jgi:hypothetical protein
MKKGRAVLAMILLSAMLLCSCGGSRDVSPPALTLTSTATSPTKTSPIPMTATFSEAVTGFVVGDITLGNGTAGNFVAVSTTVYTFDVTPSGQGAVTVDVADGVAQDSAANGNTAATQYSITYDSTSPTLALTSTATSPTKTSPIPMTATFSEAVTGFVVGDITVGNGTAGNFLAVSTTVYTFDVTPRGQGAVTVDVAADTAQDSAANGNTAAIQFSLTYDSVAPTLTLTSTATSPTKVSPIPMTATFSEAVTGFAVGDIMVGNGTAGNFVAVSTTGYTFDVTPSGQGAVTVNVAADVAQDAALNGNTAAIQFSITYAPDPPAAPAIPAPPPDSEFDNVIVDPAQEGDVTQIQFGTPGKDKIEQYGGTGNTIQFAEGAANDDWLLQIGGQKNSDITARAGDGNDTVYQFGGQGDNTIYAEGGSGDKAFIQVGGEGNNRMTVQAGTGHATIEQYGGAGTNTMEVHGSTGDDSVKMYGGAATDTMTYTVTAGTDNVTINAGQGDDTLTINKNQQNFTLVDNNGNVIFKSGDGGSEITVSNVEHIKVIGDDGTTIFQQG